MLNPHIIFFIDEGMTADLHNIITVVVIIIVTIIITMFWKTFADSYCKRSVFSFG